MNTLTPTQAKQAVANYVIEILRAYVVVDEEAVSFDPECADMGNPEGARYAKIARVTAETADGRRFIHEVGFDELAQEVNTLASKVARAGKINMKHWNETYEVYGSSAWALGDLQREQAHQMNPATAGTVRDY